MTTEEKIILNTYKIQRVTARVYENRRKELENEILARQAEIRRLGQEMEIENLITKELLNK